MTRRPDPGFWRGRDVLVTGHTGFKGSWLVLLLHRLGARVSGLALPAPSGDSTFAHLGAQDLLARHRQGDIRDPGLVAGAVKDANPSIVLHLAAQAVVSEAYADPAATFATNVQGTIHVLEALRGRPGVDAAVVVTSDKVYRNDGSGRPFREGDPLGGEDPYSASKAACEIAVASWIASFGEQLPPVATARAGNVIGGGDFAVNRIVPDLARAERTGVPLVLRRPEATRPFQHVLDVLAGYLLLAEDLAGKPGTARAFNFGPAEPDISVAALIAAYGEARGRPVAWRRADGPVMAEAARLALDSSLARETLRWAPALPGTAGLAATATWYDAWLAGGDVAALARSQLDRVLA